MSELSASPPTVRFAPSEPPDFATEVRERVREHFESRGISDKANATFVVRAAVAWGLVLAPFLLMLTGVVSGWLGVGALCVVMGIGAAGVGFSVGHDAIHGAVSRRPWVNGPLALSFPILGASAGVWRLLHNRVHHTWTNVHDHDVDLNISSLVRVNPETAPRRCHRWQHLYAWALYPLATLNWAFVKDYAYMAKSKVGPVVVGRRSLREWALLVLGKAIHYSWTIVLPVLVLQPVWWKFILAYVLVHLTAGTVLGIVFQLAHLVEEVRVVSVGPGGKLKDSWAVHQMRTTANFAQGSRLLTWYVGGLNHQIEHHLFPQVCSVHYRALGPIVEECARRHGVPYNAAPTLLSAVRSHARTLRRLGRLAPVKA